MKNKYTDLIIGGVLTILLLLLFLVFVTLVRVSIWGN
jgi:hypothetical protein